MPCLGSVLPSSQVCVVMLCGANKDFAFEHLLGRAGRRAAARPAYGGFSGPFPSGPKHRGVFVVTVSLQLRSLCLGTWKERRTGGLEGEYSQGSSLAGHKQALLAAALQALACCEQCAAEEFGSALPSLLPSVGLEVRRRRYKLCAKQFV